jgi:hypothetical protein
MLLNALKLKVISKSETKFPQKINKLRGDFPPGLI